MYGLKLRELARTGNTTGIPPRIGFDPSSVAASLSHSCSVPSDVFQDVTVAPWRLTVTDSPEGKLAWTTLLAREIVGWGGVAVTPMAAGLLERSIPAGNYLYIKENTRRGCLKGRGEIG